MTKSDTPSPLAAAVEALLKSIGSPVQLIGKYELPSTRTAPVAHGHIILDLAKVAALRAALAADAAWRARAEAAVAVMEAEVAEHTAYTAWSAADDIQSAIEDGVYQGTLPDGMTHAEFDAHVAMLDTAHNQAAVATRAARRRWEEAARG